MGKEQVFFLQKKRKRSAGCTGSYCKAIFQIDDLSIKVDGAVTILYDRNYAVEQSFYFCPQRDCVAKPPVWTNIAYPTNLVGEQVPTDELQRVKENLLI